MSILIQDVYKNFGDFHALEDINLEVEEGQLVALLGPSGSGKSTLLRAIAGLEPPDRGNIVINGQDSTHLDVRQRNIGFVFQHYALFKHLTIRQNIAFGLDIHKHPKKQIKQRVEELLELIQLKGLGDRYPAQLSGGQRQRVALARALAVQPQVLLLDEPFGALDAKVRKELRDWLRNLHEEVHVTSIFVTHDQEEAMAVADKIVVMNEGKIQQIGTPTEIYDHPATPFVMSFIGEVNVLPSTAPLIQNHLTQKNDQENQLHCDVIEHAFVRPRDLEIQNYSDDNTTQATIKRIVHLGWEVQVELYLHDNRLLMAHLSREQFNELQLEPYQEIFVKPRTTKLFASNNYS